MIPSREVLPGLTDIGITARLNKNGFVAVDIGLACDEQIFTPEYVAGQQAELPGWRFQKEYLRNWQAQTGQPVFDAEKLDKQKIHLCDPVCRMDVETGKDGKERLVECPDGRVLVWVKPDDQPGGVPAHIEKVVRAFGMGIDVGEGVSQSDSTMQVFAADGREQAAEFASNKIIAADLGRLAAVIARYYNNALVCPVRPLHGITVIRVLVDECGYNFIWRDTLRARMTERSTQNLGWAKAETGMAGPEALFGGWIDDINNGYCKIHSLTCFQQHQQYVYDEFGHITHQKLAYLPLAVRQRHGDLVIAAALARRACIDLPKFVKEQPKDLKPVGSFNWRMEQAAKNRKKDLSWE